MDIEVLLLALDRQLEHWRVERQITYDSLAELALSAKIEAVLAVRNAICEASP